MSRWTNFVSTATFYRFNPHCLPCVRWVLCKMGRHDYEAIEVNGTSALLECFYCEHQKTSFYRAGVQ